MELCQKCGTLMLPSKSGAGFTCPKCKSKLKTRGKPLIRETIAKPKKIRKQAREIVDTLPKTGANCKKCGNNEAYFWVQQIGGADTEEPSDVQFFKCTKCGYVWRKEV
jgi:DNA-directed RNA polymerase subunit M